MVSEHVDPSTTMREDDAIGECYIRMQEVLRELSAQLRQINARSAVELAEIKQILKLTREPHIAKEMEIDRARRPTDGGPDPDKADGSVVRYADVFDHLPVNKLPLLPCVQPEGVGGLRYNNMHECRKEGSDVDDEGQGNREVVRVRSWSEDDTEARDILAKLGAISPLVGIVVCDIDESKINALYARLNLGIVIDENRAAIVKAGIVHKRLEFIEPSLGDSVVTHPMISEAIVTNSLGLSTFNSNNIRIIGMNRSQLKIIIEPGGMLNTPIDSGSTPNHLSVTEDLLQEKLPTYGKVLNVVIMKDTWGNSRGFGFVNFELPKDAKEAAEAMNVTQMGLKMLFVGRTQKRVERDELLKNVRRKSILGDFQKNACNMYVRNFDFLVDENRLQEFVISNKLVDKTPASVAHFLRTANSLDKAMVGDYLRQYEEFSLAVMHAFGNSMKFLGLKFHDGMHDFLKGFRLLEETQIIVTTPEKWDIIIRKSGCGTYFTQSSRMSDASPASNLNREEDAGALSEAKGGERVNSNVRNQEQKNSLAVSGVQEACDKWRLRGNQSYKCGNLTKSEEFYTNGINAVPPGKKSVFCPKPILLCYSNIAVTRVSLGRNREAIEDCLLASALDRDFLKIQLRTTNYHLVLGKVEEASVYFSRYWVSGANVCLDRRLIIDAADGLRKACQEVCCKPSWTIRGQEFQKDVSLLRLEKSACYPIPLVRKFAEGTTRNEDLIRDSTKGWSSRLQACNATQQQCTSYVPGSELKMEAGQGTSVQWVHSAKL